MKHRLEICHATDVPVCAHRDATVNARDDPLEELAAVEHETHVHHVCGHAGGRRDALLSTTLEHVRCVDDVGRIPSLKVPIQALAPEKGPTE